MTGSIVLTIDNYLGHSAVILEAIDKVEAYSLIFMLCLLILNYVSKEMFIRILYE